MPSVMSRDAGAGFKTQAAQQPLVRHLRSSIPQSANVELKKKSFTYLNFDTKHSRQVPAAGVQKALFIGVNYTGSASQLNGCVSDAHNMQNFLKSTYNFPSTSSFGSNVKRMTDESQNSGTALFPTRDNILSAFQWLIQDAKAGDSLFVSYSGHGGIRKAPEASPEITGYDELIYPVDFVTSSAIVDDDIFKILVAPLSAGVRLTALFDSCYSGTIMDLPLMYNTDGTLEQKLSPVVVMAPVKPPSCFNLFGNWFKDKQWRHEVNAKVWRSATEADVICFSGCKDTQLSTDVCSNTGCYGAMTWSFIRALQSKPAMSYESLLMAVRQSMIANRYTAQTPCLSSNHLMDMSSPFAL